MKSHHIKLPSNNKFGFFITIIFGLLSIYLFVNEFIVYSVTAIFLSVILLTITIVNSKLLLPLNKAWMTLGFLLSKVANPILMGAIFFGIFTPISLFMKVIGRDELHIIFSSKKSFWKNYNNGAEKEYDFKYQF